VFYTPYGSACAFVERNRSATVFVDLSASTQRQSGLLEDLYWLLSKQGVGRVSALIVLGPEGVNPEVWNESLFRPGVLVNAPTAAVQPLQRRATLPRNLSWFFNESGEVAFFSVQLGRTRVLIPPAEGLRSRLNVSLPDAEREGEVRGERYALVLPGSAARSQQSAVASFLRVNRVETVILQGRGQVPDSLLALAAHTTFLTQAARREIDVRRDNAVHHLED